MKTVLPIADRTPKIPLTMNDLILLFILFAGTLLLNRDTLRRDWREWKREE